MRVLKLSILIVYVINSHCIIPIWNWSIVFSIECYFSALSNFHCHVQKLILIRMWIYRHLLSIQWNIIFSWKIKGFKKKCKYSFGRGWIKRRPLSSFLTHKLIVYEYEKGVKWINLATPRLPFGLFETVWKEMIFWMLRKFQSTKFYVIV